VINSAKAEVDTLRHSLQVEESQSAKHQQDLHYYMQKCEQLHSRLNDLCDSNSLNTD